ncbi:MAG: TolC family protein [Acidobacteriota bacterium]|nr:TolC family protein [Acidobacteriota bacterium]
MKRLPNTRAVRSALLAAGLLVALGSMATAQTGAVISARPGERTLKAVPEGGTEGMRLSLDEAVALAVANNQDLNVSVNAAEASNYILFSNMGIFDPLAEAAIIRAHSEEPATSQLVGADVSTRDNTDISAQVTQLAPTGGTFSLGFAANRTSTNSTFFFVNPSYFGGLTFSFSQPLLRNFGRDTTTWLIRTARNSRDASYQNFIRSVQGTVNGVEQAYWDLVYALRNLEVQREARVLSADLNRITQIKIDVGSLAPIDIVQTEVGIATAEQQIIIAEGLIGDAQDRLKRLLNLDPAKWNVPIVPTDEVRVEQPAVSVEDGMRLALSRRPEIIAAAYNVDSDRIRYEYWRNQTKPALDLVGSYGNTGIGGTTIIRDDMGNVISRTTGNFSDSFGQVFDRDFKNWSLGLRFSYPILNRRAKGQRGAALYTWEANKAGLTALEQNVLVEVRAAARDIDTASRSIAAAQKSRELAERNLDAERKKFENGMTTSFQVLEITSDLSLARVNELQALAIYRKALSAYHYAIADILDWKSIRIEDLPAAEPPREGSRSPQPLAAPPPAVP